MAIHKGKIFIDVVLMYTKPFTGGNFAVFDVVLKGCGIREQASDVLTWQLSKAIIKWRPFFSKQG